MLRLDTGTDATPSTDPYLQQRNADDENDNMGEDDGDEPTMDTGPRFRDKRPSSSRGGREEEEGEQSVGVRV